MSRERQHIHDARQRSRDNAREGGTEGCPPDILEEVDEDRRYAPYIERQRAEIEQMRREGHVAISTEASSLKEIAGLSNEMIERLVAARPETLSQASRVHGVTPAALTALWLHAKRHQ
ncbi:hypothetical protein AB5I41_21190 [Sphingomonas sp. MMS24-JH45]